MENRIDEKNKAILASAFKLYVAKSIEEVTLDDVAADTGYGRATVYRHYKSKTGLAIAVAASVWGKHLSAIEQARPLDEIGNIPAIDRLSFTLDNYIFMYQKHRDLLKFNDNFNHFITHEMKTDSEELQPYYDAIENINSRFHLMYEKAKEDKTFRTDIPEDEFFRITLQTMMSACNHYVGGIIWKSDVDNDYSRELVALKNMIINYVTEK